ncbi:MAG: helix-turn-helix domain-containing protein [Firmicutes bacterium]|nr:helix-turn-helix domain-containing protein [Bacillota bacterium]
MRFGGRLRIMRKQSGLRLVDLAERTGLSYSYLSQLETGSRIRPSDSVLEALGRALNVHVDELRAWVEEDVPRDRVEDLRSLAVRNIRWLEEISSVLSDETSIQKIITRFLEQEYLKAIKSATKNQGLNADIGLLLSGISAHREVIKEEMDASEEKGLSADVGEPIISIHEFVRELKLLNDRLTHLNRSKEVEELAFEIESLGERGVEFIREQIKIAKRYFGKSPAKELPDEIGGTN